MRDYAECSVIAKRLRFLADDLENAYGAEEGESLFADAADAIEELLAGKGLWHRRYQLEHELVEKLRSAVPKWISVEDAPKDADTLVGYFGGGDYDQLRWYAFACVMDDGTVLPTRSANSVSNEHCIAVYAVPEPPKEVE